MEYKNNISPIPQYSLRETLLIWAAAAIPMWILGWGVYPFLSSGLGAVETALLRIRLLTGGLIWQFILSMWILYREEGNLRIETIGRRYWLNHPVSPKTGLTQKSLWWWLVPLIVLVALLEIGLGKWLEYFWVTLLPFFAQPAGYDPTTLFTPEMQKQWIGQWSLLGLFATLALFNTFLGEEFLFRGVLLPQMNGAFGKWDWVANGILFSFYRLHQPWGILAGLPANLIFAWSGKNFRNNWFPIILHSGQSIYFLFLILGLVLGLA
jgi:membrane protease YdiL (CAAX protease family)